MSDSEAPRDSLFSSVAALSETWAGPVVVSDLAKQCCEGNVTVRPLPEAPHEEAGFRKGHNVPCPPRVLRSAARLSMNSPSHAHVHPLSLSQSIPRTAYGAPYEEGARPCFTVDNVLSREECAAVVEASLEHHDDGSQGFSTAPGCRSQFVSNDPELSALLFSRIKDVVPAQCEGGDVVGLMSRVAHCRYFPGQVRSERGTYVDALCLF